MSAITRVMNGVMSWVSNPVNAATTAIGVVITQVAAPYFEGLPSGTGIVFGQVAAHVGRALVGRCVRSLHCPMKSELLAWCNEVAGTPEYANRLIAAQRIRECYVAGSGVLYLNYLGLTSLPAAIGRFTN